MLESISKLSNLKALNLSGCKQLRQLSGSLCALQKLVELDMSMTSVAQLPEDFGCLERLRKVQFKNCGSLERLPESFSELSNLTTKLNLWRCKQLQQLPGSVFGPPEAPDVEYWVHFSGTAAGGLWPP